jgi:putative ABC transport system permease protein
MKARDVFGYSFSAIKLRKLRAGLTTLGVVIGIAAIVALLSITQGLQSTITTQLEQGLATDTVVVTPGSSVLSGGVGQGQGIGSAIGGDTSDFILYINDTATVNAASPDVEDSIAIVQKAVYIQSDNKTFAINVIGVDFAKYAEFYSNTFVAESGNISLNPENDTIVIGKRLNDPWKNGTLLFYVNDYVNITWPNATARPPENEMYTGHVAAVLQPIGGFSFGGPSDTGVYIPISQAQSFFGTDECNMIIVKLKSSDKTTVDNASEAIENAFNKEVSVISSTAVLDVLSSVFSVIQLFLVGIAAISLLVAGIGIMNIMIVSLIERTREIGILKALGMKSRTVLMIFLSESVIIGLIGAVIGMALGWGLANVVAVVLSGGGLFQGIGGTQASTRIGGGAVTITPVLTPMVLLGALVFGVGVSVIFALYPAWRASKLKPVEALRYE